MKRAGGFTLIELLSVLAIVAVLLAAAGRLFGDGWVALHRILRGADDHQAVTIIMHRWQRALRGTQPPSWQTDGKTFRAADLVVRVDGDRLVFQAPDSSTALHLPARVTCAFSIEQGMQPASRAVLTLAVPSTSGVRHHSLIRLVACGGPR